MAGIVTVFGSAGTELLFNFTGAGTAPGFGFVENNDFMFRRPFGVLRLGGEQLLQTSIDNPFSILQPFVDFLLQLLQTVAQFY